MGAKPGDLIGIVGGDEGAAEDASAEEDDDAGTADLSDAGNHVDEFNQFDGEAGFFLAFADGGVAGVFVEIDKAARSDPEALLWIACAPGEEDLPILFDEDGGGDLWIDEVDEVTGRADGAQTAIELAFFDDVAALSAEFDGEHWG